MDAHDLQAELLDFENELAGAVDEMWPATLGEAEGEPQGGWATRMEDRIKERETAVKAVLKPELRKTEKWRTKSVDASL